MRPTTYSLLVKFHMRREKKSWEDCRKKNKIQTFLDNNEITWEIYVPSILLLLSILYYPSLLLQYPWWQCNIQLTSLFNREIKAMVGATLIRAHTHPNLSLISWQITWRKPNFISLHQRSSTGTCSMGPGHSCMDVTKDKNWDRKQKGKETGTYFHPIFCPSAPSEADAKPTAKSLTAAN